MSSSGLGARILGQTFRQVLDVEVSDALDGYAGEMRGLFDNDELIGVYLYGSVVSGDYRPGVSDVDVVVLHRNDPDDELRRNLAAAHQRPGRHAGFDRLDVSFVPLRLVGTYGDDTLPYLRDGRFHGAGGGDLNMVTWRSLRERGVALRGVPPAEVVPPVSCGDLAENMRVNLAFLAGRMPAYVAMGVEETVFGILSICRVLYTLRTGDLIGKIAAARWALDNTEPRWRPLIQLALRRYEKDDLSGRDDLMGGQAASFADYAAGTLR